MELFLQNLRHALRSLSRQPGFALMAILTLALGIGANTAMFSVVNGVVLKPLPYPQAERLMEAGWHYREFFFGMDQAQFDHLATHQRSLQHLVARTGASFTLGGEGGSERIGAQHVSADYFRVLGVQPALGRMFSAEDDRRGVAPTVIIDDALWRRRFNADPGVIGRSLRLDEVEHSIHVGSQTNASEVGVSRALAGQSGCVHLMATLVEGSGDVGPGIAIEPEARNHHDVHDSDSRGQV